MSSQALCDLGNTFCASQVGAESRQPEIDDVRVGVVEARQHGLTTEIDHASLRSAQTHDLGSAARKDPATRDGKVAECLEAGAAEGTDAAACEDQVGSQATVRLSACRRSTSAQTP